MHRPWKQSPLQDSRLKPSPRYELPVEASPRLFRFPTVLVQACIRFMPAARPCRFTLETLARPLDSGWLVRFHPLASSSLQLCDRAGFPEDAVLHPTFKTARSNGHSRRELAFSNDISCALVKYSFLSSSFSSSRQKPLRSSRNTQTSASSANKHKPSIDLRPGTPGEGRFQESPRAVLLGYLKRSYRKLIELARDGRGGNEARAGVKRKASIQETLWVVSQ